MARCSIKKAEGQLYLFTFPKAPCYEAGKSLNISNFGTRGSFALIAGIHWIWGSVCPEARLDVTAGNQTLVVQPTVTSFYWPSWATHLSYGHFCPSRERRVGACNTQAHLTACTNLLPHLNKIWSIWTWRTSCRIQPSTTKATTVRDFWLSRLNCASTENVAAYVCPWG